MKQADVMIGGEYRVKIGGRLAPVTVERSIERHGHRTRYQCMTGDTGRRITCTAGRLRPAPARPAAPAGIQPGDRVQYSATFLRSIGTYTGELCFATGTVTEVEHHGGTTLAAIDWSISRMPLMVNVANLVTVADKHLECIR